MKNIFLKRDNSREFYLSCNPKKYDEALTWRIVILSNGLFRIHCDDWSYDYGVADAVTMREAWRVAYGKMRRIVHERREERKRNEQERKRQAVESAYWMAQQQERFEALFEGMEKAIKHY